MKAKDKFYRDFGYLVSDERKGAGLSQAQLARKIGLTRASIANIEGGRRPSLWHAYRISQVLGVRMEDLLPRESRNARPLG